MLRTSLHSACRDVSTALVHQPRQQLCVCESIQYMYRRWCRLKLLHEQLHWHNSNSIQLNPRANKIVMRRVFKRAAPGGELDGCHGEQDASQCCRKTHPGDRSWRRDAPQCCRKTYPGDHSWRRDVPQCCHLCLAYSRCSHVLVAPAKETSMNAYVFIT